MKNRKVQIVFLIILCLLGGIQSLEYYKNKVLFSNKMSSVNKNIDKKQTINVDIILDKLRHNNINIKSINQEGSLWIGKIEFTGDKELLKEYVKYIEECNININSYRLERNDIITCNMEVQFP